MIQDEGWKLDRTNYYQEGWLATGNARGLVGVTFTTSHCRTRATELPLRANYNLRGHRSEASFIFPFSLSHIHMYLLSLSHVFTKRYPLLATKRVNIISFFVLFPLKRLISVHLFNSYHPREERRHRILFKFVKKVFLASSIPLLRFGPSNFSGRVVGQIGGLSSLFRRGSFRENTANFYTANTCDYVRDEN